MVAAFVAGTVMAVGRTRVPVAWIGLELNLLGFVPAYLNKMPQKSSAMIYFVVQSVGSLCLLFGCLASVGVGGGLTVLGVVLKLGVAPLHFWMPTVAGRLWGAGLILLATWQKVAPLYLLRQLLPCSNRLVLMNAGVGALCLRGAVTLTSLVVFRGLVQMRWVLALSGRYIWHYLWLYYASVVALVSYWGLGGTPRAIALLNAGGLPPITGFLIKVRALLRTPSWLAVWLLGGRGVALAAYGRMAARGCSTPGAAPAPLVLAVCVGAV